MGAGEIVGAGAGEGAAYWLRWQVPVCALVFIIPAAVAAVVLSRLRGNHLRASDLWLPCWRRVRPGWLLGYRAAVFVLMSYVLYRVVLLHGAFAFYFYTHASILEHCFLESTKYSPFLPSDFKSDGRKSEPKSGAPKLGSTELKLFTSADGSHDQTADVRAECWWTFALVIIYFALGTLISAYGCWTFLNQATTTSEERYKFLKRDPDLEGVPSAATNSIISGATKLQSYQDLEENEQRTGFWRYAMLVVYQTSAGAVILTDIVFWALIVPFLSNEHFRLNLLMGFMHSLNLLFLLLDTALNSLPFPWLGMAYFVLWSCTYVIFQWILHACGFSWWPYPFLDLSTPWAPLWYSCMALVHVPCFAFYALVVKAKNSLFSKRFPNAYTRSY